MTLTTRARPLPKLARPTTDAWRDDVFALTVDEVPDLRLSPNRRGHWGRTDRLNKKIDKTMEATIANLKAVVGYDIPPWGRVPVAVEVTIAWPKNQRALDGDNALGACKHYLDWISRTIGTDDHYFRYKTVSCVRDKDETGWMHFSLRREES